MDFGSQIDRAMRRRGWSQEQLALRSGLSQQHISQIINGRRRPRFDLMISLAQALGLSLDELAGLPPRPGVDTLSAEERELVAAYRALGEAHRRVVLEMTEGLAGKKGE